MQWDGIIYEIVVALVKFMFSKKATKSGEIFTVDLTLCSKCQIDGEDFVNFCGLLRKHELYLHCHFTGILRQFLIITGHFRHEMGVVVLQKPSH